MPRENPVETGRKHVVVRRVAQLSHRCGGCDRVIRVGDPHLITTLFPGNTIQPVTAVTRVRECEPCARDHGRGDLVDTVPTRRRREPVCGTASTYTHGCRCDACRTAWAAYRREQRAKAAAARDDRGGRLVHPTADHGTPTAYRESGCRCRPCTAAATRQRQFGANHV